MPSILLFSMYKSSFAWRQANPKCRALGRHLKETHVTRDGNGSEFRFRIDSKFSNKVYVIVVLDLSKVANPLYLLRDKDLFKSMDPQVVSEPFEGTLNKKKHILYNRDLFVIKWITLNGDSSPPTRIVDGAVQIIAPTTAEQRLAKKNELKARGTLLMALPDKHQLKFNIHKDSKSLMEAIEKRGTKLDDLFNNLKIYEAEVKGSSPSSQNIQNIAFVSSNNTDNINESVNVVPSVSANSSKAIVSTLLNVNSLCDVVIYSFFASQSNSPQLNNEDLKRGHFARNADHQGITGTKKLLEDVSQHSYALMAYASSCSSSSSGSDNEVTPCSKAYSKAYATLQTHYDNLTVEFRKSQFDVLSYKTEFHSHESDNSVPKDPENDSELVDNRFNVESITNNHIKDTSKTLRPDASIVEDWISDSEDETEIESMPKKKEPSFVPTSKHVKTPRESVKKFEHPKQAKNLRTNNQKSRGHKKNWNKKACFVCRSLNHLIKDCDYYEKQMVPNPVWNSAMRVNHQHSVRMTHPHSTRNVVPTAILTRSRLVSLNAARPVPTVVPQSTVKSPRTVKHVVNMAHSPIMRPINHRPSTKNSNFNKKFTTVKVNKVNVVEGTKGNAEKASTLKKSIDDMLHLEGILKVARFHAKNSVLFTNTECVVLSSDFKLPDENHVLLRVPRENNMYNVDLKNVVPSGDLTCLFTKATLDESNLWHRRLGHINFKTMNKLVKFCGMKGINREFSVARTSQQKVLVTKPHNKTLYELLLGRSPSIGFMRPFGCPVTILNTLDPLEKFDGTADEGLLFGYSVNSKAFRVFNSRTRIAQETLHINFLENKPNIVGIGPKWLFDIDTLTKSMNYQPVVAGNQPNDNACIKENLNVGKVRKETVYAQQYVLLPLWSTDLQDPHNTDDDVAFDVKENENDVYVSPSGSDKTDNKKHDDKAKRDDKGKSHVDRPTGVRDLRAKFEEFSFNSTNRVNAVSAPINAVGPNPTNNTNSFNVVSRNFGIARKSLFVDPSKYPDDPDMPELEDIVYSDDEEDVGVEADVSNLETIISVSPIPTTRVHKDHPVTQIIGDLTSAPQTRSMTRMVKEQGGLHQINDEDFHTYLPKGKRAIGSKWVFRNKKDEIGIVIRNKARLVAQVYVDDIIFGSTNKELCKAFEKLMKDKLQMSSMRELTFFLGLQVKQRDDGIFISQDKYVAKILKKFGFTYVKSASTPIETEKPLLKDPDDEDVDVYIYRASLDRKSTTGELASPKQMALGKDISNPFMAGSFPKTICAKRTAWNEFSCSMASTVICLATASPPQEQPTTTSESFISLLTTLLETCASLSQKVAELEQDKHTQALKILKLKKMVKKLEKKKRSKSSGRMHPNRGKIEAIDADEDITLVDVETQEEVVTMDVEPQGRINQENVNAASNGVSAAKPIVFDDKEVIMTMAQTLIKLKEKKAKLLDEQIAQKLHDEEVQKVTAKDKQEKDDMERAQVLKNNLMIKRKVLIGMLLLSKYKIGMTYDKVMPIFKREYKKVQTLFKPDKDVEEPKKKRVTDETLLRESFKKLRAAKVSGCESTQEIPSNDPKEMSEEDVQNMLEVVSVFEFKVEALQVKYHIIDWEIHIEGSRTYWKIIRVGGITEAYQDMLREFDRKDLVALWNLVKEKFSSAVPSVDNEKALWVELKRHDMFMLTEKYYPLSNAVMILMLSGKLQVEEDNEMASDLVMKIFMEANKPKSRSLDTSSK
nr:hypothetical protein [Tanacetum cinerariifolium]